jgi:hypothetical protein
MSKPLTLSIKQPVGHDAAAWPAYSDKLMKLLYDKYELIPSYEPQCNWDFDSFLNEREIADVAVFVFGNDLPATCAFVKELVIIGDGDCPVCGSNNRTEITGGFKAAEYDGDCGGWAVIGMKCNNCKYEEPNENA